MIDEILQKRVTDAASDVERRGIVQRVMNALGFHDPPEIKKCIWMGEPATMYTWGKVVLVGRVVVGEDSLECVDKEHRVRGEQPETAGRRNPLDFGEDWQLPPEILQRLSTRRQQAA